MHSPLARLIDRHIYRVRKEKRKPSPLQSEIPTLKNYTASLWDSRWARLAARRKTA
ncbi:NinE family protein [Pseudescherichia sp.]|uniref:NinE family protein n=1 Tax=Pseudescherichia sp. TaxID=2055881 RepID=UPI00289D610A|nr:NinE family protein [Pseudescherichia sp.]